MRGLTPSDPLEKIWPLLFESSRFLAAAVIEQPDGTLLCYPSWSPEQKHKAVAGQKAEHVNLPGAAYDQQLVYENHRMTLAAAKILGKNDPLLATLEEHLPRLSPVLIGASGQIKEFRQEDAYGEFGEARHRHISHLIGLFPGSLLTERKEWIEAARVTLELRGDRSTGWAMAHRLNAWARLKDGARCLTLLRTLLAKGTLPNLWDPHPPFQIDGNFGGTAGMANMLLQSHEGFIDLLPALPTEWGNGSFRGLRAIGAIEVSAEWREGRPTRVALVSKPGGPVRLRAGGRMPASVTDAEGRRVTSATDPAAPGVVVLQARPGVRYPLSFVDTN
jgi:alpha-L-fucosidase 2